MSTPTFWFVICVCYALTFGSRFAERTAEWAFRPHDTMILAEKEREASSLVTELSGPSRKRLVALGTLHPRPHGARGDEEACGSDGDDEGLRRRFGSGAAQASDSAGGGAASSEDGGAEATSRQGAVGTASSKRVQFSSHVRGLSQ